MVDKRAYLNETRDLPSLGKTRDTKPHTMLFKSILEEEAKKARLAPIYGTCFKVAGARS